MLHACVQIFDVTENLKNFAKFLGTKPDLGCAINSRKFGRTVFSSAPPCLEKSVEQCFLLFIAHPRFGLVLKKFCKIFQIPCYIESLDTCMKH
jgi:hypothetical protein